MRHSTRRMLAVLAATLVAAGCAHDPRPDSSLYARLGGEEGMAAIVDGLIREIAADERIRDHFINIHIAGFRHRLETHLCEVSGGPCRFEERSMRESHRELDIRPAAFNALVEDLIIAMDELGIAHATQNEFLALLAPMQRDIVTAD